MLVVAPQSAHAVILWNQNLIVNPGAEFDAGTLDASDITLSGWTDLGAMTAVLWDAPGGWPLSSDPGPPVRGNNFFAGGYGAVAVDILQVIDVSWGAAAIDAGRVSYELEGWLGGFASQDDNVVLSARFLDGGGGELGIASLGPVLAADRSNQTALLFRSTQAVLPFSTRSVEIKLEATRTAGSSNDGYADNLWFLVKGPEPDTALLLGAGLAMLAWARRHGATDSR